MATLVNTTAPQWTAATTSSAPKTLCSNDRALQQWGGTVYIVSPYYSATNYVDVFANINGYMWVTGFLSFMAHQSYNSSQQIWFALSRYGLEMTSGPTNDSLITFSRYEDPSNANISHMRFTNQYNTSWGNANCHINITLFPGYSSTSITSPHLIRTH